MLLLRDIFNMDWGVICWLFATLDDFGNSSIGQPTGWLRFSLGESSTLETWQGVFCKSFDMGNASIISMEWLMVIQLLSFKETYPDYLFMSWFFFIRNSYRSEKVKTRSYYFLFLDEKSDRHSSHWMCSLQTWLTKCIDTWLCH